MQVVVVLAFDGATFLEVVLLMGSSVGGQEFCPLTELTTISFCGNSVSIPAKQVALLMVSVGVGESGVVHVSWWKSISKL